MKRRFKLGKKIFLSLLCISFMTPNNSTSYSETRMLDSWENSVTSLPVALDYFSSTEYGDNIYYIGGYNRDTGEAKGIVQIYNTKTNSWSYGAEMPTPRFFTKSVQYDGKIYCFGGVDYGGTSPDGNTLDIIEIYDINKNTWSNGGKMPEPKEKMDAKIYNDKVLLIGGVTNRTTLSYSSNINVFNLKTNTWEDNIPINIQRAGFTSEIHEDKLYVFGGNESDSTGFSADYKDVNIYDFKTKIWTTGSESTIERHGISSIRQGFDIYIFGGRGNYKNRTEVEVYNIKTNSWRQVSPSPIEIHWGSAIVKNGNTYCVSGEKTDGVIAKYTAEPLPKASSNIDVYIKPQNILSLSLNTNTIVFDEFNFIDEIEIPNSIELSISSSLPYQVKTSLVSEIKNNDGTKTLNPEILSIKANNSSDYKTFNRVGQSILLLDNQSATDATNIGIDMRLNKGTIRETDNFRGVIQIEVNQI